MIRTILPAVILLVLAGPSRADEVFAKFVDDYYAAQFSWDPGSATYAGIHDYDDKLPDLSERSIERRRAGLKVLLARQIVLRKDVKLTDAEVVDDMVLEHAIRADLHELESVRHWKTNPVLYLGKPAEAIDQLMKRSFAPPAVRLKSVIGRLKMAPALLAAMKANVENAPREFADLGLIVAKGSVEFFKKDLADWARTAAGKDVNLLAEFIVANTAVVEAFEASVAWIEKELLPKAKGNYAIGADAFMKKLAAEEMLDIPLDKLLAIGEANLKGDRDLFIATAKKIDPNATPEAVLAKLTEDFPMPDDLVAATRGTIERTRKFLIDRKICTVPSEVRPNIAETPAFMRTGGFAFMDTPGAYETKATEAYYYVTPPEKEWENKKKAEHMRQFSKTGMDIITIHEAYPGHYLQFLNAKQYPTKVRKLYTCGTNVEGWAHYAEQMIVEEGYGGGDPKYLLAQLSEALLRDCRYVVGIKLHTEGWTVEQGKKFFVERGFQEPEVGFQEARRGTYNPTYLYYTLGKLQIYKLREDYKKAKGAAFNLMQFHDEFVRQGGLPIKLIRRIMLPGDAGPSLE